MKTSHIIVLFTFLSTFTLQVLGDDPKPPPRFTCECKNGATPVLFDGLCRCGKCDKVDSPIATYKTECKTDRLISFTNSLQLYCSKIENTEDCEYFKKQENVPEMKDLPDTYKKCRDKFDSISDDCEEAVQCCYILDDPKAIEEESKKGDD